MRTDYEGEQVSLFDRDIWCGRTCLARSAQTEEKISGRSSKKQSGSPARTPPTFHFFAGGGGPWRTPGTEADGPLPTEFSMHSFGERPSAAVESRLSQILEDNPLPKYSLSGKACAGIRRRAEAAGRKLPPELDEALEKQEHSA